jgi:regulator of cell morphogenesis and NO signaling
MIITADSTVADIAAAAPATIRVFQQRGIDFCCGGRLPLAEVCENHGLSAATVLAELLASLHHPTERADWRLAPLSDLVAHIQTRFHEPLRAELFRLEVMLDKVISRHGDRHGGTLGSLRAVFTSFRSDLLQHMDAEDAGLFPAIVAGERLPAGAALSAFEADHANAGAALAEMRQLTDGYTPPEGACPTFRGLYYGLSELERDMHLHVHLENNILFPRAIFTRCS